MIYKASTILCQFAAFAALTFSIWACLWIFYVCASSLPEATGFAFVVVALLTATALALIVQWLLIGYDEIKRTITGGY
jgi:hypothetical protein